MPNRIDHWSVAEGGCSASGCVGSVVRPVAGGKLVRKSGGKSLAVRGGWSGLHVAGTSAVVASVGMDALLMSNGAPSDRAVGCPAWDGGCQREMVDDWTIYELMMVVVYMFCAYVLLCIFCSQGFSRFASLSGLIPPMLVWGIVRSFLVFEHVRAAGGGGG